MTKVTPDMLVAFRAAWQTANDFGAYGDRVSSGLRAVFAVLDAAEKEKAEEAAKLAELEARYTPARWTPEPLADWERELLELSETPPRFEVIEESPALLFPTDVGILDHETGSVAPFGRSRSLAERNAARLNSGDLTVGSLYWRPAPKPEPVEPETREEPKRFQQMSFADGSAGIVDYKLQRVAPYAKAGFAGLTSLDYGLEDLIGDPAHASRYSWKPFSEYPELAPLVERFRVVEGTDGRFYVIDTETRSALGSGVVSSARSSSTHDDAGGYLDHVQDSPLCTICRWVQIADVPELEGY